MKFIDFQYVSMAKPELNNVAKASSMHGQLEAHMDMIYLCTQKHAKQMFVDSQICYAQNEHCLGKTIPDEETIADIELCAIEEQGQVLLKESQKFIADKKISWSPTLLFDGEYVCMWASNDEKDCNSKFDDVDAFAKYICQTTQMTGVQECTIV